MKTAITLLLSVLSAVAFSQSPYLEIKKSYMSENARVGAWERSAQKRLLNKSLSESLMSNVVRSSEPYAITNMTEINALIDSEKSKSYPDLKLSLSTFKKIKAMNISIDRIDTRQGREILRGSVEGFKDSQVKLVIYKGQMTGRITLSNSPKVHVIRSINGGIAATYEVDTSNITYD